MLYNDDLIRKQTCNVSALPQTKHTTLHNNTRNYKRKDYIDFFLVSFLFALSDR